MSLEPGQSRESLLSAHEEPNQTASHQAIESPEPAGSSPLKQGESTQQVPPPQPEYPPFPYRYGYPAYPQYAAYAPYTPYTPTPYMAYGYSPYPFYPYYPIPVAPTMSGLAIASLVCGLLTLFAFPYLGIAAVVCGHLALSQIRSSGGFVEGRGFALAGLILGYLLLGLGLIGFLLYITLLITISTRAVPAGFVLPPL